MKKYDPDQIVTVVRDNCQWQGKIVGLQQGSRTIYLVTDIEQPPPLQRPGTWARNTNNDHGKTFEVHQKFIQP